MYLIYFILGQTIAILWLWHCGILGHGHINIQCQGNDVGLDLSNTNDVVAAS